MVAGASGLDDGASSSVTRSYTGPMHSFLHHRPRAVAQTATTAIYGISAVRSR